MSLHLGDRLLGLLLRLAPTSSRDDEVAVLASSGEPSTTIGNQVMASGQTAIAFRGDAAAPLDVAKVTTDGGTSYSPLATRASRSRYKLDWVAGRRGKPGVNADIQNAAEATRMIADPDFELLGTNAVSGSSAYSAEGGVTLTTAGADADQVILAPHLDANQTAWTQVTWGTDQALVWEATIRTGPNITAAVIWAGLKLTHTDVTATDNDQCMVRYQDTVNGGKWQAISSIGGADDAQDSGVTVAVSTSYRIQIVVDSSRIAKTYINGTLVETSAALTDATDMIPYIGVMASGAAAAKAITVYGQSIERDIGA